MVSAPADLPAQPSLRRLRQFDIRPNRELGQNFLVDSNLLGVIGRLAELEADDVVLEIGGGLGVLSEYLAARVAHVHVVEVDARLEPALRDALDPFPAATLHLIDALDLDLAALAPAPNKVVANLPYGIAVTAVLRTIEELPGASRWVAMVQREVGARLAAAPGTAAYGLPSVLAQLACEVSVIVVAEAVGNFLIVSAGLGEVLLLLSDARPPVESGRHLRRTGILGDLLFHFFPGFVLAVLPHAQPGDFPVRVGGAVAFRETLLQLAKEINRGIIFPLQQPHVRGNQ